MTKPLNEMDMGAITSLTADIGELTKRIAAEIAATGDISQATITLMNMKLGALEKEVEG